MEERRRARRMRLESTITVRRIDSGIDEEVTIEIKDISKSGIGFFCTEILEVGSVVDYHLDERNNSRFAEDRKGSGSWREKVLWCRIYGTVGNRYVPYCGV